MTRRIQHALASAATILTLVSICLAPTQGLTQGPVARMAPTLEAPPGPPRPGTGFLPPRMDLSHLTGQGMPREFLGQVSPPSRWDWREEGKVTPVKNQGDCGSCYAFASIANLESKLLTDSAGSYDLSENNAKECNWRELNDFEHPPGNPWGSCDGGNYTMLASLFSQRGTVSESCDRYLAFDVECNTTCPYQKTLLDWRIISGDSVPDTTVLKSYIHNYGPVSTAMYVWPGPEFNNYDGSYTLYHPMSSDLGTNHYVLIVGWDDDLPHAGGWGGWITKNSWGTGWGGTCGYGAERGYFTIAYGSANIGMYSSFAYDLQDYDSNGDIMYYDEAGQSGALGYYGTTTAWGLAKFVPDRDTKATRVEFWTSDATTDVDVKIYDDFDGSTPSNLLAQKLNSSFEEAGYHSVALDPPLAVTSGNDIIVMLKLTNKSLQYPVPADQDGPIETGRTYISPTGAHGSWQDMGVVYGVDAAIRLRTSETGGPVTPTPTSTSTPTATPTPTPRPPPKPVPDVGVQKAVIGADFQPDDLITFTLAIANTGGEIASGVLITDVLPAALDPPSVHVDSSLAMTVVGAAPIYVWSVEPLSVGETGVITITGRIRLDWPPQSVIINRATIWDPEDRTPHNNVSVAIVNGYAVYLPLLMKG